MPRFLVFRLYGPLASWGDIAVGEIRPSRPHPGRSALLGLIAAALGIRREEAERLAALYASVGFAVRCELGGTPLRDYHTAQVPPGSRSGYRTRADELGADPRSLSTVLSRRDYRCDGLWTVAVWSKERSRWSLEDLKEALRRPRFVLYLGRKSCPPALPLAPMLIEADSIAKALGREDVSVWPGFLARIRPRKTRQVAVFWEDGGPDPGIRSSQRLVRRDVPLSRTKWEFETRFENQGAMDSEV